jgi:peroxiredoxin Q/BCP
MLSIGSPAPEFTLPNQDNTNISLSDFRGKWVVVYFYPKDDTPGCTVEACSFRDGMAEFAKHNIEVLGISKDTVTSHKKFADKYKLNFTILSDPNHTTIEAYDAWAEKSMFGKKYMGIVRSTVIVDPKGNIAAIFPKVTPQGHEAEVLATITQSQK